MNLDNLIIATRVRTGWSAIDLGLVVARHFWFRSLLLYLTIATPVFIACHSYFDTNYWIPYVILWWCKPLFERPILFMLSRELFKQPMGFWRTLRQWRQWMLPGLGWVLTLRRISITRGMYAPVSLLERPSASDYSKRTLVLGNNYASQATWLTVVLYHIESFLVLAVAVLLATLFPNHIEFDFAFFNTLAEHSIVVDYGSLLLVAVVAPFYTAAGFMLYICRRVELEGWDIEICFRDWVANSPSQTESISGAAHD